MDHNRRYNWTRESATSEAPATEQQRDDGGRTRGEDGTQFFRHIHVIYMQVGGGNGSYDGGHVARCHPGTREKLIAKIIWWSDGGNQTEIGSDFIQVLLNVESISMQSIPNVVDIIATFLSRSAFHLFCPQTQCSWIVSNPVPFRILPASLSEHCVSALVVSCHAQTWSFLTTLFSLSPLQTTTSTFSFHWQ